MFAKIIFCLILLSTIVLSNPHIENFEEISGSLPKDLYIKNEVVRNEYFEGVGKDEAIEQCAKQCLDRQYFCHLFVIFDLGNTFMKCQLLALLGTKFKESKEKGKNVAAAYKRSPLPTEQDLIHRFSYEAINSELEEKWMSGMRKKYNIRSFYTGISEPVLRFRISSLRGELPTKGILIHEWLTGKDLSDCQVNLGNDYKHQLYKALKSWEATLTSPETPSESLDIIVLTFINIFFQSWSKYITTIYDPTSKILIVDGPKTHMLIRSFGGGDYIVHAAIDSSIKKGTVFNFMWATTNPGRLDLDEETFTMFKDVMMKMGRIIADDQSHRSSSTPNLQNELQVCVRVIINVIRFWMERKLYFGGVDGIDALYRDHVTAVISNILFDDQRRKKIQSNMYQTLGRPIFKSNLVDVDIVVTNEWTTSSLIDSNVLRLAE